MKKWISLAIIGIMFFSSIAYAGIQGLYQPAATQQQQAELPGQLVLVEKMSQAQSDLVISRGLTVATYRYDATCVQCQAELKFLEDLVFSKEFQSQIVLEEVQEKGNSSLEITSFIGTRTLDRIEADTAFRAFCDYVANPPLACTGA